MSAKPSVVSLLLAVWGLSSSALAQGGAGAPLLHGKLELGLEDAVGMGLENNLGVQVARFGPILAELDAESAWGAYDPELFANIGRTDAWVPSASPISAGIGSAVRNVEQARTDGGAGFRGNVPILGADYEIAFETSETRGDSFINTLNSEYNSGFIFSLQLPLLRDLIWNQPWTQVRTTRIQHVSAREDFRRDVMNVVSEIENAYWQLIADEEEVRVARKSLETARALLGQTETQFEVGVVSKVEVTEADAGVEAREFNLIVAENTYRNQQDVLIDLVLGPGLRAPSTLEILPTDRPEEFVIFEIDIDEAVQRAFSHRPELEVARKTVERQEVEAQFAWNQRLPQLDLLASYATHGLSGRTTGGGAPVNGGDFDGSIDDHGNTWNVAGLFSIPIPNTTARKTYDRRTFELRRSETELQRLEQDIILEVRQSARNLLAAQEGIESAERATEAAQEQLRAEKIRHEYGEATPFDVLQREEDLVDREVERIEAYRAYRSSATALDRAQGTILRNRNIRIDEVTALR